MPGWLLTIIIDLVLKLGVPKLLEWLKKRFGINLTSEQLTKILDEHNANTRKTKKKLRDHCSGVGCPPEVKSP